MFYDKSITRIINSGKFPAEELFDIPYVPISDNKELLASGMKYIKESEGCLCSLLFVGYAQSLNKPEIFSDECHLLYDFYTFLLSGYINRYRYFSVEFIEDQVDLGITALDKSVVMAIYMYWNNLTVFDLFDDTENDEHEKILFGIRELLSRIYRKELSTGKTVDVDLLIENIEELDGDDEAAIFDYFFDESWNADSFLSEALVEIDEYDLERIKAICDAMNRCETKIASFIAKQTCYVNDDENIQSWDLFLNLCNHRIVHEKAVVNSISDANISRKIHAFQAYVDEINSDIVCLGEKNIQVSSFVNSIKERFGVAPDYCFAKTADGRIVPINRYLIELVSNARTFNYLLIVYHLFRLNPNRDNAERFFLEAYKYVIRNTEGEFRQHNNAIGYINGCRVNIEEYYKQVETNIPNLKFDKIQDDDLLSAEDPIESISTYYFNALNDMAIESFDYSDEDKVMGYFGNMLLALVDKENGDEYESEMNRLSAEIYGQFSNCTPGDYEKLVEQIDARRIVFLVNILYLLVQAIDLIRVNSLYRLNEKGQAVLDESYALFKKVQKVIERNAYNNIDINCMDIGEYRLFMNIDSSQIEKAEARNEIKTLTDLHSLVQPWIENVIANIDIRNIEQVLNSSLEIRKRLNEFPDSDWKKERVKWFDSQSAELRQRLIECVNDCDSADKVRSKLIDMFGDSFQLLPASTVTTLTTAEMLYEEYVVDKNNDLNIDYSFISALFYQSVEDAYNILLWEKYIEYINAEGVLDGLKYLNKESIKGYFPDKPSYYVFYNKGNGKYSVKKNCMMNSFVTILDCYTPDNQLMMFRRFLEILLGYSGREDDLREKIDGFRNSMKTAATRRNDSSHAHIINRSECVKDREMVIGTKDVPGVMFQLVSLFRDHNE